MNAVRLSDRKAEDMGHFRERADVREIVRDFVGARPRGAILGNFMSIVGAWVVIIAVAALSNFTDSWLIYLASVLVIASRQHALLALMHEAAHKRDGFSDLVSDLFCGLPALYVTRYYRHFHLQHHTHTNGSLDPDWMRKESRHFGFPKRTWTDFFRFLFREAYFESIRRRTEILFALLNPRKHESFFYFRNIGIFLGYGLLIHFFISWSYFFAFWFMPYVTVLPLIFAIRSSSEHFGLSYDGELGQARDILCGWLEREIFAPHNLNFHLCHHLFPEVDRRYLPELHNALMAIPEFAKRARVNSSFFFDSDRSVLSDLVRK